MCMAYKIMSPVLTEQIDLPTIHPIILNPTIKHSPFLNIGCAPPLWLWSLRPLITSADPCCDVPFPGPTTSPDPHHTHRPSLQGPHHLCSHLHGPRYLRGPTPLPT